MMIEQEEAERVNVIENAYTSIIKAVGEDPTREGILKTPNRAANAFLDFCQGYNQDLKEVVNDAVFSETYNGIITVKNIDFFSMCEHHLVPFFGHVSIGYIPNGKVLGLSKFARIVEIYSRRLQLQEHLTDQILDAVQQILNPKGVAVIIEGTHLCMVMRGVRKADTNTITTLAKGELKSQDVWPRFMNSINKD